MHRRLPDPSRRYPEACDAWNDDERQTVVIAMGEGGWCFGMSDDTPGDGDGVGGDLKDPAGHLVGAGLVADIPAALASSLTMR